MLVWMLSQEVCVQRVSGALMRSRSEVLSRKVVSKGWRYNRIYSNLLVNFEFYGLIYCKICRYNVSQPFSDLMSLQVVFTCFDSIMHKVPAEVIMNIA